MSNMTSEERKAKREAFRKQKLEEMRAEETRYQALQTKAEADPSQENLNAVSDYVRNNPYAQHLAQRRLSEAENDYNQQRYVPILKTILSGAGVMAAVGQINQANAAQNRLIPPSIPTPPAIDPALNNQIFNAQRGSLDAGRVRSAADIGINDAYNQAVQEATNTASGQSGIRQALINKANLNKMRANAGVLPMIDQVRAREEGRADQLVGERARLGQGSYDQLLRATGMGLEQYNRNAQAIGALGAVGRENLFNQLGSMPENLVSSLSYAANPYSKHRSISGDDTSHLHTPQQYEKHLDYNLGLEDYGPDQYKQSNYYYNR